ncbi:Nucleolar RNA helicase 2 [Perkinsus chesapeaki]|uniref:Nucleolar RNA helicase 2 n=1 Tax=Perkinsus chesapeaki TaxID=330153 RepID=A0A7J6N3Q4_PERCH|nr:Nucleolar RNA helicase 2 [Perkinsus chesapeaki]
MSDAVVGKVSELGGSHPIKVDLVANGFSYRQPATVRSTSHKMIRLPERANLTRYRGLCHVLRSLIADSQALIFANTTKEALAIARHPAIEALGVKPLHSDMPQSQRDWLLNSFRGRRIRFLVTTDLLSRGIDLPGLQYVILFRPPEEPTAYIHRAGRTGRAGEEGEVITLYDKSDWPMMQKIIEATKQNFDNTNLPTEEELRSHAYAAVATEILSVHQGSWKCLEGIAQDLVAEGRATEVMARIVSLLNTDGQLQPKKSKVSLYSGVPDFTAVMISDFEHSLYPSVDALKSRVPCPLERVRKAEAGWVADVPNASVDYLMKSGAVEAHVLERVPKTFDAEQVKKAKGRGLPWRHARELTKLRAAKNRHKRESRRTAARQGIPFVDHRISRDEWAKTLKPQHVFPLDQLPVLEFPDGKMAVQSYAILRYVATLRPSYGLYPNDPLERLRIDQIMETFADIREKTRVVNVMPEGPTRATAREELLKTVYPFYFDRVQSMIGNYRYSAGDHLTISDLVIDSVLDWMFHVVQLSIRPTILDSYAQLQKIQGLVSANPAVKLWREKREVKAAPA